MAIISFWKKLHLKQKDQSDSLTPMLRVIAGMMIVITLVGTFWAGMFPIRGGNDEWWHLKIGKILWEYFQEHGFSFPPYDVFTYTGEHTPWINHEWLAHLIFYLAYSIGDIQGAIVLKSLVLTLTFALLIYYMYRNGVGWKIACLGTILALLASKGTLDLRPTIFTYLFMVIFLHLILSFQLGENFRWSFVGVVVSEIIWINLHGGAIIGIILVFFWWLSELWFCLINWLKEHPTDPSFRRLGSSTLVLIAVGLASLVNPFTYHIHTLGMKVTGDWFLLRNIGELQSPDMHIHHAYEVILLGLLLLPMLRAGSIWIYEGLAIVFFGHQSLNYVRHIPLFALVAIPPLMSALDEERSVLIPAGDKKTFVGFWGALCYGIKWSLRNHVDIIIGFVVVAYLFGMRPGYIWHRNWVDFPLLISKGYDPPAYPEDAVNFILYKKIPGPMFNHDNFAGYLIWRLAPEKMKLFTDSRYDLWGSRYAKEEIGVFGARTIPLGAYDAWGRWYEFHDLREREEVAPFAQDERLLEVKDWYESKKPYWQYILDKYNANFILSYEGYPIDRLLRKEFLGWFLVYDQKGYVIHLRDKPENAELIRESALNHKTHIPKP